MKINNILQRITHLFVDADSLSDSDNQSVAEAVSTVSEPETESVESRSSLNNAIDSRSRAVSLIVDALRDARGSQLDRLAHLNVWIQVDRPDFDPSDYAWADQKFVADLRRQLDDSLLSAVGSKAIQLRFATADDIQASKTIVDDCLYLSWGPDKKPEPVAEPIEHASYILSISCIRGGSLVKSVYDIDGRSDATIHIGRGRETMKGGVFRVNDIEIRTDDPRPEVQQANNFVSSAQADIVVRAGTFYLRAARGGCRTYGGCATKIIISERIVELTDTSTLHKISNGDMIELGKSVVLKVRITKNSD